MGGTDETSNLIALTPKQHYEAHYLLWKAYRNPQMTQAFHLMLWNKGDRCRVSADEYQLLKEDYSKARKLYWENLSDDDMEVFKEKSNPWKNKTEEEWTEYRKRCNAWLNKSEEEMQAMKDNTAQKVKAYYANPENSEAIESWKQKRLITYHKTIANRTDEDRAKMKNKRGNTMKNKRGNTKGQAYWVNNGQIAKRIGIGEPIPVGWVKGRLDNFCKGTFWINNGSKNRRIGKDDIIPSGWIKGKKNFRILAQ